jgi:coenzyme F420-reducing hydrogenase beta subunit
MKDVVAIEDVECIHATDKAIRVRLPDGDEHWIPQSQVDEDSEVWKQGDEGKLVITAWIAAQRGIE